MLFWVDRPIYCYGVGGNMITLYNKDTHGVVNVYSGDVSQIELMQSEFPDINLGEYKCEDAAMVLSNPMNYMLAFDETGEPYRWYEKPTVELVISPETIGVNGTSTLTITVKDNHPLYPVSAVSLLFEQTPQEVAVGTYEIVGSEAAIINIKADPVFCLSNTVELEVLP